MVSPEPREPSPYPLGHERYCAEVVRQTDELRGVLAARTDLSAPVPSCPDWSVGHLLRHVGGTLRRAEALVRTGAREDLPDEAVPGLRGPAGDAGDPVAALDDWLAGSARDLADALRTAGPAAEVWSWGPDRTAGFWARRTAHEVVVHRADAQLAVGLPYTLARDLAADALDERLGIAEFVSRAAPCGDGAGAPPAARSVLLAATDTPAGLGASWLVRLEGAGLAWSREGGPADVTLRGPLTELLLAAYLRLPPDDPRLEVLGEREVLERWLERSAFV